jgi:subtilase family serine protease
MLLVLQRSPAQESALKLLLDQLQQKSSPNYHKWFTPEQFGQQFGVANQDIHTVTAWLSSHGLHVDRVAKSQLIIEFSGTAGQVKEAFHTEIHQYEINGKQYWANSADPAIPTAPQCPIQEKIL